MFLSVVLTQFILMVSWEVRHREIWCYVSYIWFHSPLKGEWLTFRHKTLFSESLHSEWEAGLSACAGVMTIPCWENNITANWNSRDDYQGCSLRSNIYQHWGERAIYLEKFTIKLLDRMNNSWSESTLSTIKKESIVIY